MKSAEGRKEMPVRSTDVEHDGRIEEIEGKCECGRRYRASCATRLLHAEMLQSHARL